MVSSTYKCAILLQFTLGCFGIASQKHSWRWRMAFLFVYTLSIFMLLLLVAAKGFCLSTASCHICVMNLAEHGDSAAMSGMYGDVF